MEYKEYVGHELLRVGSKEPIKAFNDLGIGEIYNGWCGLKVESFDVKNQTATAYNLDGTHLCFLEFDKDDRHCWVHTGTANIKALKNLTFTI